MRLRHRRIGDAGRDGIDGYTTRPQLASQSHSERDDAGLGRAVKHIAERTAASHRGHGSQVDDTAPMPLLHGWRCCPYAVEDAAEVDAADALPIFRRRVEHAAGIQDAGTRDQDVNPAASFDDSPNRPRYAGRI